MCPQSPSSHPPPPKNKQDQAEIAEFKYHYRKLSGLVAIIWGHYFHCICILVRPKVFPTMLHNLLRSPRPRVYYSQHERKQILKQIKGSRREHFSQFLHVDFSCSHFQHNTEVEWPFAVLFVLLPSSCFGGLYVPLAESQRKLRSTI